MRSSKQMNHSALTISHISSLQLFGIIVIKPWVYSKPDINAMLIKICFILYYIDIPFPFTFQRHSCRTAHCTKTPAPWDPFGNVFSSGSALRPFSCVSISQALVYHILSRDKRAKHLLFKKQQKTQKTSWTVRPDILSPRSVHLYQDNM